MNQADFDKELQKARISMQHRRYPEALRSYSMLAEQSPQSGLLFEYGSAVAATGDFELADQLWEKTLSFAPPNAAQLVQLAREYSNIALFAKAGALYARAAKLEPGNLGVQLAFATHLSRANSVDDAREVVNQCLGLDPKNEWARYFNAHLDRRDNKNTEAEQQFRDLIKLQPGDPQLLSACHLELARILDRMERYDEAMTELEAAKRVAAPTIDVAGQRKAFEERCARFRSTTESLPTSILDTWGKSFPAQTRAAAPPVGFLGGHLRSGTTLLERILDAHPSAAAYDESLAIQTIVPLIDVTAPEIPASVLNLARQRYVKNLTRDSDTPDAGKLLLDKNPGSTVYLPALLRAFPELRVLIALRDPRDVLVSSYYIRPVHYMHLALDRLAENYCCVMDVWLAIRQWEGLNWMETRYEDVVADLPKEGARVTKFLGLEWNNDQASFHEKNKGKPVKNYNEVTKPVYSKAIGRWQAYEKYLAPILPTLEPFCKRFGYD